jgi:hypothetical protein
VDRLDVRIRGSVGFSKPTCTFFKARPLILPTKSRMFFLQSPFAEYHENLARSGFTGGMRRCKNAFVPAAHSSNPRWLVLGHLPKKRIWIRSRSRVPWILTSGDREVSLDGSGSEHSRRSRPDKGILSTQPDQDTLVSSRSDESQTYKHLPTSRS